MLSMLIDRCAVLIFDHVSVVDDDDDEEDF
jgi:hypothetical protein